MLLPDLLAGLLFEHLFVARRLRRDPNGFNAARRGRDERHNVKSGSAADDGARQQIRDIPFQRNGRTAHTDAFSGPGATSQASILQPFGCAR